MTDPSSLVEVSRAGQALRWWTRMVRFDPSGGGTEWLGEVTCTTRTDHRDIGAPWGGSSGDLSSHAVAVWVVVWR